MAASSPSKPRFSWPMRVFLFIVVFNIVFRSLTVLIPWEQWRDDLDMRPLPVRLSTPEEMVKLAERESEDDPHPVRDDFLEAFDSVWEFARPLPGRATRGKLHSAADWGKFAVCWLSSRFEFVENVVGINQEWPMFSPNVSRRKTLARARLTYADGSERIVRQTADPEDLTCYAHWFQEKILDYELHVRNSRGRMDDCTGYCNLLAHRHARNEDGSSLIKIRLFEVTYHYPPPDVDASELLREQTGPPPHQTHPVFFEYDMSKRKGQFVDSPQSQTP